MASALNDTWALGLDRVALAKVGRTAENEAVGAPTGIMDQMTSMLGQTDAAIFLDCRSFEAQIVDLGFAAAGLELLVMDTGVKHSHATGGYRERRESCELGARTMGVAALRDLTVDDLPRAAELLDDVTFRRVRHIVTENQRVIDTVETLRTQGPKAIGDLLVASHVSMRDDFEISVAELDTAVDAALVGGRGRRPHDRRRLRRRRDRARRPRFGAERVGCRDRRIRGIRVPRPAHLHRHAVGGRPPRRLIRHARTPGAFPSAQRRGRGERRFDPTHRTLRSRVPLR